MLQIKRYQYISENVVAFVPQPGDQVMNHYTITLLQVTNTCMH